MQRGSFYKFYESKEMLFFAVLENIHSELYGVADHALSETDGLPPSERAAKAVLAVCRRCPIPATWFSLNMTPSCFYRDCRRASKRNITTMTKRIFVSSWKNMI